MDMITSSAKNDQEEDDDEEEEEEFTIKKEPSPHARGLFSHQKSTLSPNCLQFMMHSNLTGTVKVEAKTIDQKPNTPRSKHSATEQRRRSKINDRHVSHPHS